MAFSDFSDVVAKLLFTFARIAAGALRFDNRDHITCRVVEAIVGDTVPWCGIVAVDRHFSKYLSVIVKLPARSAQFRIDENITSLCLVKIERTGMTGMAQNSPCGG